jgi:hypothetical protein
MYEQAAHSQPSPRTHAPPKKEGAIAKNLHFAHESYWSTAIRMGDVVNRPLGDGLSPAPTGLFRRGGPGQY